MTLTITHAVASHEFLQGLKPEHLQLLVPLAAEATFQENELILVDGQRSGSLYLLLTGSVAVELRTPGFVVCVQAVGPGEAFGWSSLLSDQDTLFQVRARELTRTLRIDGAALKQSCKANPPFAAEIFERTLQLVAGRVRATEIRFAEMCGIRV